MKERNSVNGNLMKQEYNNYTRTRNNIIKDAKFKYEKEVLEINKNDTKSTWNYVNNKLGKEKRKNKSIKYTL